MLYLALILLLATAVRMIGLGREPLENDEFYSMMDASSLNYRSSRPVFYLFLYCWKTLFGGDSVLVLRFPALLFGVLSVYALFFVGRKLFNTRAGLLASLFLALSPFHIFHSQYIRMYTFLTFFSLLSLHAFLLLHQKERPWTWLYFLGATLLAILSHPFAAFIPMSLVLYLAVFRKNDLLLKKFFLLAAAGCLLILISPLRSIAYEAMVRFEGGVYRYMEEGPIPITFNMPTPTPGTVVRTLLQFCGMPRNIFLILIIALFFGLPFLLGFMRFREGNNITFTKHHEKYLCLIIILFPMLSVFFVSQFLIIYVHRYFIFALPLLLLVIAASVLEFKNIVSRRIFIAGVLILSLYSAGTYYAELNNPDIEVAADHISSNYLEGDRVITTIYQGYTILNRYWSTHLPVRDISKHDAERMEESIGNPQRIWLFRYYDDQSSGLSEYLDRMKYARAQQVVIESINLNSGRKTPRYEVLLFSKQK